MAFHNVPPNGFPDLPDVEELESVVKDVTNLKTSVSGLSEDVSDLNDNKANQITIAPFFDEETAYEVGDLVYYNGLSYRCTNAHEGEWDADDFAATTISNELASLMSGLTGLEHDRFIKAYRGNIDGTGSINVQLVGSRLYQYYVYRDDPSYVGFGMIDTNYANDIHTNPIITTNLVTFTDSGNGVLTIANGSDYAVGILIVDISASFT